LRKIKREEKKRKRKDKTKIRKNKGKLGGKIKGNWRTTLQIHKVGNQGKKNARGVNVDIAGSGANYYRL
jgi:hypothetical protein